MNAIWRERVLWAVGILYAAAVAWGLYAGWANWRAGVVGLFGRDGLAPLPADWRFLFGYEEDLRLPLQLIAGFLALSLADWAWRATFGRLAAH